MFFIVPIALFAFGAIIASFGGVLVARLNTGHSFLTGRSCCDACTAPLSSFMLIPIVSYIVFRGRAHCCGARISILAPLTELLLGGLFVLAYFKVGSSCVLLLLLTALSLLLALVLYDLAHQILPPVLLTLFVTAAAAVGFFLAPSFSEFLSTFFVALGIAAFLALIHFFSRGRAMGFSDAPLAFGLALLTGSSALPGFIFSFWIGAIIGIIVLFQRPVGSRIGVEVPFAPYLAAGFLLAYFTQWNPFIFVVVLP